MAKLEVITGPMFSGKSEELIRRLKRATYAEQNVLVVKPKIDTRTAKKIAARRKKDKKENEFEEFESFPAHEVSSEKEFIDLVSSHGPDVLAIDEAQFFTKTMPTLPELIGELLDKYENSNMTILVSGLDLDAWKRPFGIMPEIITMADPNCVLRLSAICFRCKKRPANLTYKRGGSSQKQIEIGDSEMYEARCWFCHKLPE